MADTTESHPILRKYNKFSINLQKSTKNEEIEDKALYKCLHQIKLQVQKMRTYLLLIKTSSSESQFNSSNRTGCPLILLDVLDRNAPPIDSDQI